MKSYLNFENDIKELESELEKLKDPYNKEGLAEVDTNKISTIQAEIDSKLNEIYSNLNSWQIALVARHEERPKSKFFIENLFDNFIPLSGDRFYGEDKSVLTGFAKFNGNSVLVIGFMLFATISETFIEIVILYAHGALINQLNLLWWVWIKRYRTMHLQTCS